MAGISSKALNFGDPGNNKKYNGIEKNSDFQIDIYETQLRVLDGQIGRWWQIDPKVDNMEMWSPYASNYDNPITYMDPLGDESEDCCGGLFNFIEDVLISASGVVNGVANTLSFGLISSDPFGMRNKLSGEKLDLYNNSATVGKVGPLLIPGGSRTKTPSMELVPVGGKLPVTVSVKTQPLTPTVLPFAKQGSPNSNGGGREKNRVANQKSGEKAQNQLEGIEKKQAKEKKNAASHGEKQNKIEIGKSKQNLKSELKKVKSSEDAKKLGFD